MTTTEAPAPYTDEERAVAATLTLREDGRWVKPDGTDPTDREAAYAIWGEASASDHPESNCVDCGHRSDCATHNAPAYPAGSCNCGRR